MIDVLRGQSIWDVSVEKTGTIENAAAILKANNLDYEDTLPAQLILPDDLLTNLKTLTYYAQKNIVPGTLPAVEPGGIGVDQIGVDFHIG